MRTSGRARDLAGRIENQIRFNPGQHDQHAWVTRQLTDTGAECGTTACVGGWAILLSGLEPFYLHKDDETSWNVNLPGTPLIGPLAKQLLGLNKHEAQWLFYAGRHRDEVLAGLTAVREGDTAKFKELIQTNPSW